MTFFGFLAGYITFLMGLACDSCLNGRTPSLPSPFGVRSLASIPLYRLILSALTIIITTVAYQRFSFGRHDLYNCRALLHNGRWNIDHTSGPSGESLQQWEPSGCQMRKYTGQDIQDCLGGRRVVFVRDSTIRQVFWAASAKIGDVSTGKTVRDNTAKGGKHDNIAFGANGVTLEFLWDPWLNSSTLREELAKIDIWASWEDEIRLEKRNDAPALIVAGAPGLWAAHYGGDDFYNLFRYNVDHVMGGLVSPLEDTIEVRAISGERDYSSASNMVLLAPVQIPAYNMLSPDRQVAMTPDRIDLMNRYLFNKSRTERSHILWAYNGMTANNEGAFDGSGLHVVDSVAAIQADIVLNARCNSPAAVRRDFHKGTCCTIYPRARFETAFLNLGILVSFLLLGYRLFPDSMRRSLRMPQATAAAGQLLFAAAWCQFTDRTTTFSKISRHYNQGIFLLLSICWLLISLSSLSLASLDGETPYSDGILSRQQSDEIRGFMQVLVLLYHYYYASQTLWVYKLVRLCMSGYFFLSAFGHSTYFLRKRDFSFGRVAIVIFRLNALTALLPYAVNSDYNSYYFAPAITFWYLVVYLTHRTYSVYNQNLSRFLLKVLIATGLVQILIFSPGLLEWMSRASYVVFRMTWDAEELRFRLRLDRYIVFIGIVTASLTQRLARFRAYHRQASFSMFASGSHNDPVAIVDPLLRAIASGNHNWTLRKPVILLMCAAVLTTFFVLTSERFLPSKESYNALHPFISWVPVLAFLAIRNAYGFLRKRYMHLPAALGRFSLETYVLQYHMWLGNDATARLTTGLFDRYGSPFSDGGWLSAYVGKPVEATVLTIFFVATAAATHRATDILAQWLFGPSRGRSRRRPRLPRPAISAVADPSSSSKSRSRSPGLSSSGATTSEAAALGLGVVEMQGLGAGPGERRRQGGTSTSTEGGDGEAGNDDDGRKTKGWRWKTKKSLLKIFVTALSGRRRRRPRLRIGVRSAADILEDPRFRAAALLLVLWTANWLYC